MSDDVSGDGIDKKTFYCLLIRNAFRILALPKKERGRLSPPKCDNATFTPKSEYHYQKLFMIFCKSHEGWVSGWSGKGNRSSWWVGNGKLEVKLVRGAGQVNGDTAACFWNLIQVENWVLSKSHT